MSVGNCVFQHPLLDHASANIPPARLNIVAKRAPTTAGWLTTMKPIAPLPDPLLPPPLPELCPLEPVDDEPEAVVVPGADGTNVALGLDKQELAAEAAAAELAGALGLTVALPAKSHDCALRFVIS